MRIKSILFKNFIVTACLFVVCFLLFGVAFFFVGRAYVIDEKQITMHGNAEEIERIASAYHRVGELNSLDLRMNISTIARSTGNHIFLCNAEGMVVSCSDMEWVCPHIGAVMSPYIMAQLGAHGSFSSLTSLGSFYNTKYYVIAEPIVGRDNHLLGYVFIGYDPSGFMEVWGQLLGYFVLVSILVLALSVALEWLTSSRRSKPLREMAEAAHSFSRGDFSVRVHPYRGEDELGDLTDAFNSMAEALERNESLRREFIANVSHELRTPMTTIAGFADGILDGTIPPSDESKYLQTISSETKRLSRLVRSMLDMSRLQDGASGAADTPFDHTELVLQTLMNFEERINKKELDVALELPEEHLFAVGNVDALTRVVYNILDNALKFSEPGSRLGVSLWKKDGRIYTRIADHGETIPAEELPLIFDRFHKADRSRSRDRDGVGLGLYMVKAILDSHDQDIYVTSENGVTAFTFTLAQAQRAKSAELPAAAAETSAAGQTEQGGTH